MTWSTTLKINQRWRAEIDVEEEYIEKLHAFAGVNY